MKLFNKFSFFVIFALTLWGTTEGYKILFLTPLGSRSHKGFFMGITEALAQAGHHVTLVSTHKPIKEKKNIREVILSAPDILHFLENAFDEEKHINSMLTMLSTLPEICIESLADPEMQKLKNEQFDLVILSIIFDHCFASLAHHFNAPLIHASPAGLLAPFSQMIGAPQFPSLHKSEMLPEGLFPYSFLTRLKTTIIDTILLSYSELYLLPRSDKVCREAGLCSADMPNLKEINNNASLTFISRVELLESPPQPTVPNIIYVGGIHCHPSKPLPQELEDWVSTADEGFIYFSLGSALKPSSILEKDRKTLVKVFGSLKQKVLWKWDEDTMDDLPDNVRLGKWLPQQDLLGHKKLKLFITHGGLLSTLESSYHAVPIIGMPVAGDQHTNIAESISEGWAAKMDWNDLEENALRQLILDVMSNDDFKKVVKHRSKIMRDVPRHPKEEVVYWVEYVLRHGGAEHLKSPLRKIHLYELYNMDVWALLAGVILTLCLIDLTCIIFVYKRCCKKRPQKEKPE